MQSMVIKMFDCPGCWETPCVCGREYRNMNKTERLKICAFILGIDVEILNNKIGDIVEDIHKKYDKNEK